MSSCPPEAVRACQRGTVLSGWIRRPRSDTNYRADIDGVRAVAIIGVVGFHVGLPGFAGGFVGVDIFFVISGFLITTLLLNELRHRGSIDLLTFFARRARRLLPAFFLVLATTLLLGFFFLVPVDGEQRGLADSAVAAALYVSNWHFTWVGGGYFDAPSNLYPLLHTWSLAVEEQFYLIWPLMLLGASWAALRWRFTLPQLVAAILVAVILASSSFTWWAAESGEQAARLAFFALASRAWELGIGAALALALPALRQSHSWFGTFLTAAGLIAIVAAITTFRDGIAFPGAAALVPTLGTAAVIAGGWLAPQAPVMQLLSLRPLVTIGLLSYSWYLW